MAILSFYMVAPCDMSHISMQPVDPGANRKGAGELSGVQALLLSKRRPAMPD